MKGLVKNLARRTERSSNDSNKLRRDGKTSSGSKAGVGSQNSNPDPSSTPHDFELERHGLFVLHPTAEVYVDPSAIEIDLVAVHGLNGTARKTWTDPESGKFWLEDFLPDSFPKARIMTYGYDSGLAFSRSKAGIETFARDLLNRLRMLRSRPEQQNRPLVFIAHSLGGIVVKKALILAHEANTFYGTLLEATKGIVFMGTPHRGSELVPWALLLSNLVNVATFGQGLRTSLLKNLDHDADILKGISRQFTHRAATLKIMSFFEQQFERPLTTLVVPEYSAILNLPNEMVFPTNAHHRSICYFSSADSQSYRLVEAAIREIVAGTDSGNPETSSAILKPSRKSSRDVVPAPVASIPENALAGAGVIYRSSVPAPSPALGPSYRPHVSTRAKMMTEDVRLSTASSPVTGDSAESFGPTYPTEEVTLRISGLVKELGPDSYGPDRGFSHTVRLPAETSLHELGFSLAKSTTKHSHPKDTKPVRDFGFKGAYKAISEEWTDIYTTPVLVTSGRPCYNLSRGLKINYTQKIATFFSKAFPDPMEVKLDTEADSKPTDPFSRVSSKSVSVARKGSTKPDLIISFQRTIRIPEDNKEYDLPPGLGCLPLFNILPFTGKLPPAMVAQGGLFVPLYQFEATWIQFTRPILPGLAKKFAIRPYIGGVNGISGEATIGDMGRVLRKQNSPGQDYIVLPEQLWLDGISVKPGVVKQFVATAIAPSPTEESVARKDRSTLLGKGKPQNGSDKKRGSVPAGASIEYQITGKDEIGGLQLHIIPAFDTKNMSASSAKDHSKEWQIDQVGPNKVTVAVRYFDPLKTPEEEGLRPGDTLHVKDRKRLKPSRPRRLGDLLMEAPPECRTGNMVELVAEPRLFVMEWMLHVHLYNQPEVSMELTIHGDDKFEQVQEVIKIKMASVGELAYANTEEDGLPVFEILHCWFDLDRSYKRFATETDLPNQKSLAWVPLHATGLRRSWQGHGFRRLSSIQSQQLRRVRRNGSRTASFLKRVAVESISVRLRNDQWVLVQHDNQLLHIKGEDLKHIADVKLKLHKQLGIPACEQTLFCKSVLLKDGDDFSDYSGQVFDLIVAPPPQPQALGFGAGGSILQAIEPDTNDPRIWDVDAASILNVQIIDARTFRLVTGLDPPPTPITAETCKEMDIPLYQFPGLAAKGGASATGVSGKFWDGLAGVAEVVGKGLQEKKEKQTSGFVQSSASDPSIGLLPNGGWGPIDPNLGLGSGWSGEASVDLPVVLLAVDDSFVPFKSILDVEDY